VRIAISYAPSVSQPVLRGFPAIEGNGCPTSSRPPSSEPGRSARRPRTGSPSAGSRTSSFSIEQFDLDHHRGASNDHSRIIRHHYHSNTYGRLTQATYHNWERLHRESDQQVLFKTGGLDIAINGTPGEESVENCRRTLADNGHPYEALDTAGLVERFPQSNIDEDVTATHQADSGMGDIRRAVQTRIGMVQSLGVTVRTGIPVRRPESFGAGVRVHTDAKCSPRARPPSPPRPGATTSGVLRAVRRSCRCQVRPEGGDDGAGVPVRSGAGRG
jgi:hypothetical protein